MPLIPMGIASQRGPASSRDQRCAHAAGPVLRCSMMRMLTVSIEMVSVLTTRRGGWGAAETPRPGPAPGVKVCGAPAQNFFCTTLRGCSAP
jgi:hypothetical protein